MTNAGGSRNLHVTLLLQKGTKKLLGEIWKRCRSFRDKSFFLCSGVQPSSFLACSLCVLKTEDWFGSAKRSKWIDKGLGIVEVSKEADT